MSTEITHQPDGEGGSGRYVLLVDGTEAGEIDYRDIEGRRAFTHTGIREQFEGQGLAGKLARRVLDDARSEDLQILPVCPYIASYIERHPDDADLVDQELWKRFGGS